VIGHGVIVPAGNNYQKPKTKRPSLKHYQPFGMKKYLAFAGTGNRPVQW
jgi:hypothetical protein